MIRVTTLLTLACLLLAACAASDGGSPPSASESTVATVEPSATAEGTVGPGGYRDITLDLGRGIEREGRDYGHGTVGIVLTHMGRPGDSQEDWAAFAAELAAHGYRAVTFDHDSQFVWRQVLAGVDLLRADGVETVIAIGASHGAMASLRAGQEPDNGLAGVVWLAGVESGSGYAFDEAGVADVACPILFASGTDDEYGAAEDTEMLAGWAQDAELLLVESALHGTDILLEGGPVADELRTAMLDFVERVAAGPTEPCA